MSENATLEKLASRDYQYGFVTDVAYGPYGLIEEKSYRGAA